VSSSGGPDWVGWGIVIGWWVMVIAVVGVNTLR
jgi:hypothetical protein